MKKVLVVCAHPDDETLGLGGTLALHSLNKDRVEVLIFADGESSRDDSMKKIEKRNANIPNTQNHFFPFSYDNNI